MKPCKTLGCKAYASRLSRSGLCHACKTKRDDYTPPEGVRCVTAKRTIAGYSTAEQQEFRVSLPSEPWKEST